MTRIFLHGLGQGPDAWAAVLGRLAGSAAAAAPDLAEWLRSGDGTYASLLRAVSDACRSASGPVDLCGLSLGAVLALHHTAMFPQSVRSLVLIAPQVQVPARLLALQSLLFRLLPEHLVTGGASFRKKELLALTRSMAGLDLTAGLCAVTCPTLVVCGQRDRPNRAAAEHLAAALPQAALRIVSDAGHEVNRDSPQALAEALNGFWQSL